MKLEDYINEFIPKRSLHPNMKAEAIRNLFFGSKGDSVFIRELGGGLQSEEIDADLLASAIMESVRAYTRNKDHAIEVYKQLVGYIEKASGYDLQSIQFPPIPVANTFERLMFLSKYLQEPENKTEELENLLWVSSRTIEADLAKLRGRDDDPLQVCGKRYVIEEMDRDRRGISFSSTPHPFFLTCNLTQVMAMLKGLREVSRSEAYKEYALTTAREIWSQLSEYAKKRIFYVLESLMAEEISWYQALEAQEKDLFLSERRCSRTAGAGTMISCLKNGETCYIEYEADGKSEFLKGASVLKYQNGIFQVKAEGQEYFLEEKRILHSAYAAEDLI